MVDFSQPVSIKIIVETIIVLLVITGLGILLVNYRTKKMRKENK